MPTPPAPTGRRTIAATVLDLFVQLHDQVRGEIRNLDEDALNWAPITSANSIAALITHLVGSEAETLRTVAGLVNIRDREAEFTVTRQASDQLLARLHEADRLITDLRTAIDGNRLRALFALPTLSPSDRRSGLTWLVGNYGHAREHVGHIQLTKELYHSDVVARSDVAQ
jgi:hypothetical protein